MESRVNNMKRTVILMILFLTQFTYSETQAEKDELNYKIEENTETKSKNIVFTLKEKDILKLYYVDDIFQRAEISEDLKTENRIVTGNYFMNGRMISLNGSRWIRVEDKNGKIIKTYDEGDIKYSYKLEYVDGSSGEGKITKKKYNFYKYYVGSYKEKDNIELYNNVRWSKLLKIYNEKKYVYFYAAKISKLDKKNVKVNDVRKDGNILEMTYTYKDEKMKSYFIGTEDGKYIFVNKEDFIRDKILDYDRDTRNYNLCESYHYLSSDVFNVNCSKKLLIMISINQSLKLGNDNHGVVSIKFGDELEYETRDYLLTNPIVIRKYDKEKYDEGYRLEYLTRLY